MKKILALAVTTILFVNICGCEKQNGIENKYTEVADFFVYENVDYNSPLAMAAGEDTELFTAEPTEDGTVVRKYGENGEIMEEFPVSYMNIYDLYYSDHALYIGFAGSRCAVVDRLDLQTGEIGNVCEFEKLSDLRSISEIGGEIIAIGTDVGKSGLECRYMINGYSQVEYSGRGIYSFKDGTVSEIVTDFPFEAEGFGDSVIIYGCNDDEGFYFRKYERGRLSEPSYTDQLGAVKSLCAFAEDGYITSAISRFNVNTVVAGNILGSGAAEIMPNIFIFGLGRRELAANDGFCWILDDNGKNADEDQACSILQGQQEDPDAAFQ